MPNFIKIQLQGQGWGPNAHGDLFEYQRFANLIAEHLRSLAPLDGQAKESRTITVSVCEQIDSIHFIEGLGVLTIPI